MRNHVCAIFTSYCAQSGTRRYQARTSLHRIFCHSLRKACRPMSLVRCSWTSPHGHGAGTEGAKVSPIMWFGNSNSGERGHFDAPNLGHTLSHTVEFHTRCPSAIGALSQFYIDANSGRMNCRLDALTLRCAHFHRPRPRCAFDEGHWGAQSFVHVLVCWAQAAADAPQRKTTGPFLNRTAANFARPVAVRRATEAG